MQIVRIAPVLFRPIFVLVIAFGRRPDPIVRAPGVNLPLRFSYGRRA